MQIEAYIVHLATQADFDCYVDDHGDCNSVGDLARPCGIVTFDLEQYIENNIQTLEEQHERSYMTLLELEVVALGTDADGYMTYNLISDGEIYAVVCATKFALTIAVD
jgi:hypothetical protein